MTKTIDLQVLADSDRFFLEFLKFSILKKKGKQIFCLGVKIILLVLFCVAVGDPPYESLWLLEHPRLFCT